MTINTDHLKDLRERNKDRKDNDPGHFGHDQCCADIDWLIAEVERLRDMVEDTDLLFGRTWRETLNEVNGDPVAFHSGQVAKLSADVAILRDALKPLADLGDVVAHRALKE